MTTSTKKLHGLIHTASLLLILCWLGLALNGCAPLQKPPVSRPPTSPPPTVEQPVTGPAAGLYTEAENAMRAGNYANAEMLLERALRIEPRNPHYWYTLALLKYRLGQYRQTIQFCLKTDSLAGREPQLAAQNRELLQLARAATEQ